MRWAKNATAVFGLDWPEAKTAQMKLNERETQVLSNVFGFVTLQVHSFSLSTKNPSFHALSTTSFIRLLTPAKETGIV
jgi:hypothetical protein